MCPVSDPRDLQRQRGFDSRDSLGEDELSSLASELGAEPECSWVFVGVGSIKATPGLDIKVSHIFVICHVYRFSVMLFKQ